MNTSFALPYSRPPAGMPVKVLDGVYLLRMPMPFRLDHINLYLLEDSQGWTLVDCGLNTQETMVLWEALFTSFLHERPLTRIIVNHLHPDHIGLAEWLQRKTGASVLITQAEWKLANELFYLPQTDPSIVKRHYRSMGFQGGALDALVKHASGYRRMVKGLPQAVEIVSGGQVLTIGARSWEIRVGKGHSPECACLWNQEDRVLIAGDHVLPRISPNINMLCVGPGDPLDDYLRSLEDFHDLPCELLLPAHGLPITRFRTRVSELQDHHREQLARLEALCTRPSTVAECLPYLFDAELPDHQLYFAAGETAAHLAYLAGKGRMTRAGADLWTFQRR